METSDVECPRTLAELRSVARRAVLLECVSGSRAYGIATAESDEDVRGLFVVPAASYLALASAPLPQLSDERGNVVFYSLRRAIELLSVANPTLLELLFMPADCVRSQRPEMKLLLDQRSLFVTQQCASTHAGYAMAQIKKARGQNKWINNPKDEAPPRKEAYCHVIPHADPGGASCAAIAPASAPFRPVPLARSGWNLAEFHAARLEHSRDAYRLYHYGPAAKGVFRGEVLVCESIPVDDERERFAGLLLFNEQGWKQALADHQHYWAWRRERNESRWAAQERGELDYDAKNLMHTVRLLLSGRSILERGEPIIRFEGEARQLLLDIRAGRMGFDAILELAQGLLADCERLKSSSALPLSCDLAAADRLLAAVTAEWEASGVRALDASPGRSMR